MTYKQDLQDSIQELFILIDTAYKRFPTNDRPKSTMESATFYKNHHLGMVAEFQEERDLEYGVEKMHELLTDIEEKASQTKKDIVRYLRSEI